MSLEVQRYKNHSRGLGAAELSNLSREEPIAHTRSILVLEDRWALMAVEKARSLSGWAPFKTRQAYSAASTTVISAPHFLSGLHDPLSVTALQC